MDWGLQEQIARFKLRLYFTNKYSNIATGCIAPSQRNKANKNYNKIN